MEEENGEEFKLLLRKIKETRMKELFAVIKSSGKNTLLEKFGGMILYNQMLEEDMKNLILLSNEINNISEKTTFDRLTFGMIKEKFAKFVIKLENYKEVKSCLDEVLSVRNVLIHNIFDIEYFFDIVETLDEYMVKAEKTIELLNLYRIKLEIKISEKI